MTDKRTNDRTQEEEMMDNTFDSFDDDMATQTQSETVDSNAKEEKPKAKSSSNKTLFLLVGGAAVLVVGYMFAKPFIFGGDPQPAQPVAVNQPQPTQPVVNNGNGQTPPIQVQQPVTPTPNPLAPANNQIDPAAASFLTGQNSGQNPLAGNRTVENMQQQNPPVQVQQPVVTPPVVVPTPVQQPQVVVNTPNPVVVENTPSNVTVTPNNVNVGNGNNVVQAALIDELKGMFEKQTKEIKGSIDAVGDRVSVLEKSAEEQKDVNKSIEERLAKLEAGQTTKEEVEKAKAAETKKVASAPAPAKKPVYKAPARKPAPQKAKESDVLVDKSETPKRVQTPVRAAPQNNIQIHSVFAGRVWIKNADSSLSTYVAGEKLPTGEVIQRVDDSRGEIVTNRRVIR